mgnify:FL=1
MIKQKLAELFSNGELSGKTIKQIFNFLSVKKSGDKDEIRSAILSLCDDCFLGENGGKYYLFAESGLKKGKVKTHERGYAFFIPDDKTEDLFIPAKSLNGALQGDEVVVRKVESKRGSSDEGEVVNIISRGIKEIVGTFYKERNYGFVVSGDKSFTKDVFISQKNFNGAQNGNKVLCKIIAYPFDKNPEGVIVDIVKQENEVKTAEKAVIENAGIETEFPAKVIECLDKIPSTVSESDKKGRLDLTKQIIITIDGDDSRDFDDAISVEKNEKGFILGVHIADVSHYVKEGSEIDKEALSRATSIYFPDFVIPMLPEKLSNGICSLNEGVERLTLSCIMKIDKSGSVYDYEFHNSVIKSRNRMTYKKVQKIIDGDKELREQYSHLVELLDNANELKNILHKRRKERGSVDLDSKEAEIFVDENGKIHLSKRERIGSYQLIEEFMLLANQTVAEHCYYLNVPFVFRIHEKCAEEKLQSFCLFLKNLGIKTSWNEKNYHSSDFNKLLEKIKDMPYAGIVNNVLLRSMQKAKYSPEDVGHFGLGLEHYCHFTSPIRRYPDLQVHRILKTVMKDYEKAEKYLSVVGEVSDISSSREKRADEVERQVDDIYTVAYMRDFLGEEFNGVISGVTSFGIFVELENTAEGLVRLEDLPKGNYVFDEKTYTLFSNKNVFKLGDSVKIKVVNCDVLAGQLDFILVNR